MRNGFRLFVMVTAFAASQTLSMAQSDDTTPPTLTALSFSATSVNVSATAQNLTVNATITDDKSGVNYGYVVFTSPSGQTAGYPQSGFFTIMSGNNLAGAYQTTVAFPQFVEPGVWTVSVYLRDNAGNSIISAVRYACESWFSRDVDRSRFDPRHDAPYLARCVLLAFHDKYLRGAADHYGKSSGRRQSIGRSFLEFFVLRD